MKTLMRDFLIGTAALPIFVSSVVGCGPTMSPREREIAYQQSHFKPRLDEVLSRPHSDQANKGAQQTTASMFEIGTPLTVHGRIDATVDPVSGEVQEPFVRAGEYVFRVTSDQVRATLTPHIGERIMMRGLVQSSEPDALVVMVDDYRIVR